MINEKDMEPKSEELKLNLQETNTKKAKGLTRKSSKNHKPKGSKQLFSKSPQSG